MSRCLTYREWIDEQAALHNVDGCTGVTNWNGHCCKQHDLEFRFGKSAGSAYLRYRAGDDDPWRHAHQTTFDQANQNFTACNFREGALGYLNPFAWIRYGAMRLRKTRTAWEAHRRRDQEAVDAG